MALKISKSTWIKIGILLAVAVAIFLIYRSKHRRSGYSSAGAQAQWIPDTPAMPVTYPDDDEEYAEDDDDVAYANSGDTIDASGSMLMQSTMDDDEADAEFDPY
jgi:hypothetical protein